MSAELKREILRLLREDEEFRYAVAGYLGLQDIRTTLAQLAEAVKTLIDAVNALNSRVESLEEGLKEVKASVSSLNERVGKLEANVSSINERMGRMEASISSLSDNVSSLNERVGRLESNVSSLNERVGRLEANTSSLNERVGKLETSVSSLSERMERVEANISSLNKRMEKVEADVSSLNKRMGKVERELRSMRRTLENLTMSEEEEANLVVTHLLRERGISIETGPAVFDKRYEFDIYGTTGQLTVVGDAKVRAGPRAVRKLVERVEEAKRRWPEKLPGRVVAVLYCLRAAPGTAEEAEKLGVWLLESMREKTKPPL
jgi:chromosome segregation ATPase